MSEHQAREKLLKEHEADIQQAIEKLQKTANQYLAVYGEAGKRNEAQEVVWKDLRANGFVDRSMLGVGPAGTVDPLVLAFSEGKRSIVLLIEKMILLATDRKELEAHIRNQYKKN